MNDFSMQVVEKFVATNSELIYLASLSANLFSCFHIHLVP